MQDAREVWRRLELEEKRVLEETARVKLAWRKITQQHQALDERRQQFEHSAELRFVDPSTRMRLNVGGHMYETTAKILCRDRFSVLAALCKEDPPVSPGPDGALFIERDWWLFRYILLFLREMTLPDDVSILRELLTEAAFFRISRLHSAIEARLSGSDGSEKKGAAFRMAGMTGTMGGRRRPRTADDDPLRRGPAKTAVEELTRPRADLVREAPDNVCAPLPAEATAAVQPLDVPPAYRRGYAPAYDPRRRYGDAGYNPYGAPAGAGAGAGPPAGFGPHQQGYDDIYAASPPLPPPGPGVGMGMYDPLRAADPLHGPFYSHDRFGEAPSPARGGYYGGGGGGYGSPHRRHHLATSQLPDPFGFSGRPRAGPVSGW